YSKFKPRQESELDLPRSWNPKDVIRTGIQITYSIHYNALNVPSCASSIPQNEKVPAGMKMYWNCKVCRDTFSFTLDQVAAHIETCGSKLKKLPADEQNT
ncbi:hypothetical protein J3Q64DRAFT_1632415, partial [Phycomyces blakesleeanus]